MIPAVQTKYNSLYEQLMSKKIGEFIFVKNKLEIWALRARCYRKGIRIIVRNIPGEGIKIFRDKK